MSTMKNLGKPTQRRYSPEEKAAAVRMVRALRKELGTKNGSVQRVADQLGYGAESVRTWVRQADIDEGQAPGNESVSRKAQDGAALGFSAGVRSWMRRSRSA